MSVDPYMRGRMDDRKSYVPPFALGEPLQGGAVGEVVASRAEGFAEGDVVLHQLGWREYAVLPGQARAQGRRRRARSYLGVLGMPGLTAYVGLLDIAGAARGRRRLRLRRGGRRRLARGPDREAARPHRDRQRGLAREGRARARRARLRRRLRLPRRRVASSCARRRRTASTSTSTTSAASTSRRRSAS